MEKSKQQIATRVSVRTIIGNLLLSAFKLAAGIVSSSAAMVSDAAHSLSDVFSSLIVIAGVRMASRDADRDHQYGHERMECVASIILSVILLSVGAGIGYQGVMRVAAGGSGSLSAPGLLALVAALVSIALKEGMYWYTRAAAKKINSGALMAEAWHHRSDAFSSVGSFAGILGARLGLPVLDPIACVVICVFIVKAAYNIFMDTIGKMTDKACDDAFVDGLRAVILAQENVAGIDLIRTRLFGDKVYVDVEISVDGDAPLSVTHGIAESVHEAIEKSFSNVKHCMVHVNPYSACEEEEEEEE